MEPCSTVGAVDGSEVDGPDWENGGPFATLASYLMLSGAFQPKISIVTHDRERVR